MSARSNVMTEHAMATHEDVRRPHEQPASELLEVVQPGPQKHAATKTAHSASGDSAATEEVLEAARRELAATQAALEEERRKRMAVEAAQQPTPEPRSEVAERA